MKKVMTILMAAAMVLGFSGMATAQSVDCSTCLDPLSINRGCEGEQDKCYPFDYEDPKDYCEAPGGKVPPRVVFPVCDCPFADDLEVGDLVDVRLEILVNGKTGANGAYWAEQVSEGEGAEGIGVETYGSETLACEDTSFESAFTGVFDYRGYDEDGSQVDMDLPTSGVCEPHDDNRPTIIRPNTNQGATGHGYQISQDDVDEDLSNWAIDIPEIMFDPSMIDEGDVISVQICLTPADENDEVDAGSICGDCGCCCEFELGSILCCEEGASQSLTYPYVTPLNDANWWFGMVITNLSGNDGEAEVTIYETDGDSETITVDVEANNMEVFSNVDLMDEFGEGIGDARAYFTVKTDFSADGFLFIGNDGKSEAMGYLPRKK
ncbi:MAG: hypothetical protein ACLFNS_12690 [Desulfobacterales bacterium]